MVGKLSDNRFAIKLKEAYGQKAKCGWGDFDRLLGWSLRQVLPRVNPDLEQRSVYYPCAGSDIWHVLAATGGTRIVMLDLNSPQMHGRAGYFIEDIVEDLDAIGAENIAVSGTDDRAVVTFRNEIGCLRSRPLPWQIFPSGHIYSECDREIIYYLGKDANSFIPEEVEQGIDVYFIKGLILPVKIQEKIVDMLKPKGFLLGDTYLSVMAGLLNLVLDEQKLKLIAEGNYTVIQKE
jgi:hypothetical protein